MDAPVVAYRVPGTDLDRLVLVRLYAYASVQDRCPVAWPSARRLGEDLGRPVRSVWRSLARLRAIGAISRIDRPDRAAKDGQAWSLHPCDPDPSVTLTRRSPRSVGHPGTDPSVTQDPDRMVTTPPDPAVSQIQEEEPPLDPRSDPEVPLPGFDLVSPEPDLVARVLAHMRECLRRLDPRLQGPRSTAGNREMIATATRREGASWEDWRHVIEAQLRSVQGRPETWRFLCLSTITRPRNWARLRDAPAAREALWAPRVETEAEPETVSYFDDQGNWWEDCG